MGTKPLAIVTVAMAFALAAATRAKARRPSRRLQAKPASASLRSPTATDRSLQSLKRNEYSGRAIGRWIMTKYGCKTSFIRATSAIESSPITAMSDRSIPSQPQALGSTTI